jgi:hypothetical protein
VTEMAIAAITKRMVRIEPAYAHVRKIQARCRSIWRLRIAVKDLYVETVVKEASEVTAARVVIVPLKLLGAMVNAAKRELGRAMARKGATRTDIPHHEEH